MALCIPRSLYAHTSQKIYKRKRVDLGMEVFVSGSIKNVKICA